MFNKYAYKTFSVKRRPTQISFWNLRKTIVEN